ncbi:MAG TPA: lipopolysaccharide heptosyltransferase II [bacterium]
MKAAPALKRVLVVLPNWFGETLFTTPFLGALRAQRPDAEVTALGWPQCRQVLEESALTGAFIEYDERGRDRNLPAKWRLAAALRRARFDTAFVLRRSLSRSLLAAAAGVPARVGWEDAKSAWLLTHRARRPAGPVHKAASYFPLLEAAGLARPERLALRYVVGAEEREAAHAWLAARGIGADRRLIILHPGANWPHKRWPIERFGALAAAMRRWPTVHVAVTGGRDDLREAREIARLGGVGVSCWAGETSLRALGALLERADLVVSNDTGVLHIAAALDRPLIGLYGPTSPALTGPLGGAARSVVLHHPDCCPAIPCVRPERLPHAGMRAVTLEEVESAARGLLLEAPVS